ncbi:MAG: hypothetical protein AAF493_23350 [Pseudomonadota bacterium]
MALFTVLMVGPSVFAMSPISLTDQQARDLGERIWRNETGGDWRKLVWWNEGEAFPSVGIGHFIWYPPAHQERFVESFPRFVDMMRANRVPMPDWLDVSPVPDAPWPNRDAWYASRDKPRFRQLEGWLRDTVDWQARFIIDRARHGLPQVLAAVNRFTRQAANDAVDELLSSPHGVYVLVDYINFKGEGTNPSERYDGEGWGLVQVLEWMQPSGKGVVFQRFADAAEAVLRARVDNAPAARREYRWLPGWTRRLNTYRIP